MRTIPALLLLAAVVQPGDGAETEGLCRSAIPEKREQGAKLLGEKGDRAAAKRLVPMLRDTDWGVRMAVLRALGPIKDKAGRDAIVKQALTGEIRAIRILAAEMLRDHDPKESARRIGRGMKRFKKEARIPSIEALGIIGGDDGIDALSKQIRAPDPLHRAAAARALGRLRAGEKALLTGLKDRKEEVRMFAAASLASVDTDTARAALLDWIGRQRGEWDAYLLRRVGQRSAAVNRDAMAKAIRERLPKSNQPAALLQIAIHGGMRGSAGAAAKLLSHRDTLTRCLAYRVASMGDTPLTWEEVKPGLDHKEKRLNFAAATAYLESAAKDGLVEALKKVLRHKKAEVVEAGIRKAVATREEAVLKELAAVAKGETDARKEWMTRVAACVALGRIGKKKMYEQLEELTRAREWWLRAAAFEGIFHTYDKRAIPLMIAAFSDKNPCARMTVRRNLKYLTRKHYVRKQMYLDWWKKHGQNVELVEPDEVMRRAKKYGYATPKYVQDVLKGTDIVVVLGRWDKVQLVLEDLKVKHFAIRQQQISEFGLSPKQVVLVNCEGSVDSQVTSYLQWFVSAGGYMATTDWALVNALNRTFPAVLKGWVRQSTGNDVVVVEPADPGNPTLEGVFSDKVRLKWWLEIQAFPIAIEDPVRATVLVDSMEMLLRYGSSVMMAEFPAGLGKVMHSTSHFYLQKEGFSHKSSAIERKIFAADHLGISIEDIRELDSKGAFDNVNDTQAISKSYSMFHLLVNFIEEKRTIDRR